MPIHLGQYLLGSWLLAAAGSSYGQSVVASLPPISAARLICWQESRPLTWSDFQAKKFPKSARSNPALIGALSATTSYLTPNTAATNGPAYLVYAIFIPDSSWVNTKRIRTAAERAATLAHEQIHFDLSELTARKLRQRLAQGMRAGENLDGPIVRQDVGRIQEEENTLNDAFDQQVVHVGGHRFEAPVLKRWQQRIAQELRALAAYKSTAAMCP
jgi:hypothetical protein